MIAIDALLNPTLEHPPCGPDLEYDPQFTQLLTAARGKSEQQVGNTIIPAEQADWGSVRQQAEALLMRTKDIRVALILTRALVRVDNLPGLRNGLALLFQLLSRFWDQIHPVPDPDDADDLVIRLNALAPLADTSVLLLDIRTAFIVVSGPHGRVSVRDLLVAAGRLRPGDGEVVLGQAQIDAAIMSTAALDQSRIDAARDSAATVKNLYALLVEKVGADRATDLRPLSELLKLVAQACAHAQNSGREADHAPAVGTPQQSPAIETNSVGLNTQIQDSAEAMRALDAVCDFYERTQPGNPAPLLIRRAQRLINKNFLEIMTDLAPESVPLIRNIAGIKEE